MQKTNHYAICPIDLFRIMNHNLITPYSYFISKFFEHKVQKIPVDVGCTCPVRDGSISRSGCAFCNGRSFVPRFADECIDLFQQIKDGMLFFQRKTKSVPVDYLVYFQSGTNTYMSIERARSLVETCLSLNEIKGIVFSTRPDCLSNEWLFFLKELSNKTFVEVELGVESVSDKVLKTVGRGHDFACSVEAISNLHAVGIPVCAHLILGLPGETKESMIGQAVKMNELKVECLKLHQLQILRNTKMSKMFESDPDSIPLFSLDGYADFVANFLSYLSKEIAVERVVSQSPSADLIAPKWGVKNDVVLNLIKTYMLRNGLSQGSSLKTFV